MYVSAIAAATYGMPVKQALKAQIADDQKGIKTLEHFEDLLNKEIKTVSKSDMDRDFKEEGIQEIKAEKDMVANKIQQLSNVVKEEKNLRNHYADNRVQSVTVAAYGVSYLA